MIFFIGAFWVWRNVLLSDCVRVALGTDAIVSLSAPTDSLPCFPASSSCDWT
jgi:hypothetical protein